MLLSKLLKNKKSKKSKNTVKKLLNTQKNSKVYWFLLKVFLNNKEIPVIPSLFDENDFITDFKKKTNFSIFALLKNAPFLLAIALFLLMSTILLTNAYLQLHFQQKI